MIMTFEEKHNFALKELQNTQIWKLNYNPPLTRLLHKLGVKVRLPHYNSCIYNFLSVGCFMGLFWGSFMYISTWRNQDILLIDMLLPALFFGVFVGTVQSASYVYDAKKYKLTPWNKINNL
jgi:MFS-type transporter involved in bile tolerance (Atg22 family)